MSSQPDTFVKRSRDPRAGAGLRAEAEMLKLAAHPGVVELIGSDASGEGWELVLRRVEGSDLTAQPPWAAEEVAGFGAAAATTLADLHDLQVTHGRLGPEHLLVDAQGRPVLCGFGQARLGLADPAGEDRKAADVADLARCLAARMPAGAPKGLRRALERGMAGGRRRPATARQFARALGQSVAAARLPAAPAAQPPDGSEQDGSSIGGRVEAGVGADGRGEQPGGEGGRRAGRVLAAGVVLGGLAAALLLLAVLPLTAPGRQPRVPGSSASMRSVPRAIGRHGCPEVDESCRPVASPRGILTLTRGRYRIGEPGDVLVLGRWTCSAVAFPALLRPATGQVWAFGRWAQPGRDSTATLLGRVADARSLRVLSGNDGCDRVEVLRRAGPPVVVGWPRPPARRAGR